MTKYYLLPNATREFLESCGWEYNGDSYSKNIYEDEYKAYLRIDCDTKRIDWRCNYYGEIEPLIQDLIANSCVKIFHTSLETFDEFIKTAEQLANGDFDNYSPYLDLGKYLIDLSYGIKTDLKRLQEIWQRIELLRQDVLKAYAYHPQFKEVSLKTLDYILKGEPL